ncbi:MAG: hypothetical protein GY841_00810 [FCB group bacterium]|nr:hypothetical protein [FCB group bacterium]
MNYLIEPGDFKVCLNCDNGYCGIVAPTCPAKCPTFGCPPFSIPCTVYS